MGTKFQKFLRRGITILAMLSILVSTLPGGALAAPGDISRVSVDSGGAQADNFSRWASASGDGRYIAFESEATNLVSGDTNGVGDVFVHDRQTGATTRVSVDSSGAQANSWSGSPAISSDGRFVAFYSDASNLVNGDANGFGDIFVHDLQTGTTTLVSVDSGGAQANGSSSDYNKDLAISADGRFVAFSTDAGNLVGGDTNGLVDIFVHDRQTGQTSRVSVDSSGTQSNGSSGSPALSNDGRYVAFRSNASNLVAGDTNNKGDVFVHDRQTGQTTRVSVNSSGEQADGGANSPSISGDGRLVVFLSKSDNLDPEAAEFEHQVYVHDRQTGQTTLVSVYQGFIMVGTLDWPTISSDGHYVAFSFYDKGNGQGLMDIYVRDLQTNEIIQATQGGTSSEDSSYAPSLSANGGIVAFHSVSQNLVSGDTNGVSDVFVYELASAPDPPPVVVSVLQDCPRGCISPADPVVDFSVTFSKPVTGVTSDDFIVTPGGGVSGASVTEVIGSGQTYIVAVNTGSGDGTIRLDVLDNDSIIDTMGNPLGGAGAGNGDFNTGDVYTVSKTIPTVTGSRLADPNPTTNRNVHFTVTFSEPVSGVDASDFALASTGNISGAFVEAVDGSGNTYTVNANTGTGDGVLRLDIIDNDSIVNAAGTSLGGAGAGNGNFTSGEAYTIDRSPPFVTGSLLADANPTTASNVNFSVTFSEPVNGVDASDFLVSVTGSLSGASISGINGTANSYTVTVGTGSGNGTLRLDIQDDDSITDAFGNPLGGAGAGNGNFTAGQEYTVNKTPVKLEMETIRSNGNNDGWVLESGEDSNVGGRNDSRSSTFVLGDDDQDRQFRAILHLPTHHLPDDAVITRALLMIRGEAVVGTDPFTTHQNVVIDIRSGPFGFIGPFPFRGLQNMDFQSISNRDAVGMFSNNPYNGWYWAWLDSSAFEYINLTGITQLRLRFQLDDDDDMSADYMRFYSGDFDGLAARPQLLVEYYRR